MTSYTILFYCLDKVSPLSLFSALYLGNGKNKLHECGEINWSRNGTSLDLNYVQAAWTEDFLNWTKFLSFIFQEPGSIWSTKQTMINFYQVLMLWTSTAAKCERKTFYYSCIMRGQLVRELWRIYQAEHSPPLIDRIIAEMFHFYWKWRRILNRRTRSLNVCIMFQMIKYVQ